MNPIQSLSDGQSVALAESRVVPARPDDPRLVQALEEYALAVAGGIRLDRRQFLADHVEIADELAECLEGLEFIRSAAPQLHDSAAAAALAAETMSALSPAGAPLGDYKLLREVGRGGMGVVYEAEQLSLSRRVALKVLPFAAALDDRHLQRFKNEAQAAAHLHHTNIVPVHAVGCERGVHYYAMQFIDGQSLAQAIRQRQQLLESAAEQSSAIPRASTDAPTLRMAGLPTEFPACSSESVRRAAELGIQAAEALEHAHQMGVVHRDIKPANLLIDRHGKLWVTDFGLAQIHAEGQLTMTGDLVGTLRYMSPEQALGRRAPLDHRTDVYSLGATLYELLALEPVFDGRSPQELLRQIAVQEPNSLRRWRPSVPVELETIVLKCLAKDPNERYCTARELADDLQRFLGDEPLVARPPSLPQRLLKWSRRHYQFVASVVATLVIVLMTATALLSFNNARLREEEARTRAAWRQAAHEGQRAEQSFQQAQRAVDQYFTLVSEATLLDVPGLQPLRKELLTTALVHYQVFIQQHSADAKLRVELARAHFRLGQIQLAVGDSDQGMQAFQECFRLAEQLRRDHPESPELLVRLGGVCRDGGPLHRNSRAPSDPIAAIRTIEQGVAIWEALARDSPGDQDVRNDLACLYMTLGDMRAAVNSRAEAIRAFEQARAQWTELIREDPSAARFRANLAWACDRASLVLATVGRYPESEAARVQAVDLMTGVAHELPHVPRYREALARSYNSLGNSLIDTDPERGERLLRQALAVYGELAAEFPSVPAFREPLAITHFDLAHLLSATSRPAAAEAALIEAVSLLQKLAEQYPDLPEYRRRLATYYDHLGQLLHEAGRLDDAEQACRQALALRQELVAGYPATPRYHQELAWQLATCPVLPIRDPAGALELAQKAVQLSPDYSTGWKTLGAAQYRAGDWAAAVASLEKSLQYPAVQRTRASFLAMAHWQLGHTEQARSWHQQAVLLAEKHSSDDAVLRSLRIETEALLETAATVRD